MMRSRFPIIEAAKFLSNELDAKIRTLGVTHFETSAEVNERQTRMVKVAFRQGDFANGWNPRQCLRDGGCERREHCNAACHVATRLHRAELILSESAVFAASGLPIWFFTAIPSRWRVGKGFLLGLDPEPAIRQVARRLRAIEVKGMTVSFSVELIFCEEETVVYWAPHVHGLASGVTHGELQARLRELVNDDENLRPIRIDRADIERLPVLVNYMTKRVDTRKVRYFTSSGRPRWRNRLPLRDLQQAEIDIWRSTYPVGYLHGTIGFKRNGNTFVVT